VRYETDPPNSGPHWTTWVNPGIYTTTPRNEQLVHLLEHGHIVIYSLLSWASETFAYAEGFDEKSGRYQGLRTAQAVFISRDDPGLLVRPEVAQRQLEGSKGEALPPVPSGASGEADPSPVSTLPKPKPLPRRFHGAVRLDPERVGRVAEEVIAHLAGQPGAEVEVRLEIQVRLPEGASEHTMRTVSENSRALKFESYGFETD
jgi:hypothetical protein